MNCKTATWWSISFLSFLSFFLFFFLRPHPRRMEVPRLGVESELQLLPYITATAMPNPSHVCDPHHSSWQCQIPNPLSQARDQTRNLMVPSRIRFRCGTTGTPWCGISWELDRGWAFCAEEQRLGGGTGQGPEDRDPFTALGLGWGTVRMGWAGSEWITKWLGGQVEGFGIYSKGAKETVKHFLTRRVTWLEPCFGKMKSTAACIENRREPLSTIQRGQDFVNGEAFEEPSKENVEAFPSWHTYTTAHGNTRSLTHWVRPGIEPTTSWFLVGFVSAAPWRELHYQSFYFSFFILEKSFSRSR